MKVEEEIVSALLKWYGMHKRDLPWRENKDPYRIWISEIMLQQTRVEAVKPYFYRFMEKLPDVYALAACEEELLLKLWEGLGYYNRARNLKKAAEVIVKEYGGRFPDSYEELLKLPGIGSYTAGAIASIAFDLPYPAVDGNVMRIFARLTGDDSNILNEKTKREMQGKLSCIMPEKRSGDVNQAFMDLGAGICIPNGKPDCVICPLADFCRAYKENRTEELPVRLKKTKRRVEKRTVLVLRDGELLALRKRPEKGLLAGLYELPNFEGWLDEKEVLDLIEERNMTPLRILPLKDSVHRFSHVEWKMIGYAVWVAELDQKPEDNFLFVRVENAEKKHAIPSAFAAYAEYVHLEIGKNKYKDLMPIENGREKL